MKAILGAIHGISLRLVAGAMVALAGQTVLGAPLRAGQETPMRLEYTFERSTAGFDMGPLGEPREDIPEMIRRSREEAHEYERQRVLQGKSERGRLVIEFNTEFARVVQQMAALRTGQEPWVERTTRVTEFARRVEGEWEQVPHSDVGIDEKGNRASQARFPHGIGTVYAPILFGMAGWQSVFTGTPRLGPEPGQLVYTTRITVGDIERTATATVDEATMRLLSIREGTPERPTFQADLTYRGQAIPAKVVLRSFNHAGEEHSRRTFTLASARELSQEEAQSLSQDAVAKTSAEGGRVVEAAFVEVPPARPEPPGTRGVVWYLVMGVILVGGVAFLASRRLRRA